MALRIITAPAATPVTLAEAKGQLRIDHSDDDIMIDRLIAASTTYLDGYAGILGQALVTQTWELVLDAFPCGPIQIPLGPLQSVTSVKYDDTNGDEQTFGPENYTVDTVSKPGWVVLNSDASWPSTLDAINAVRVRFVAGFTDVPQVLRHAILMLVGHFYENRETTIVGTNAQALPFAVDALIAPFRRVSI